MTHYAVLIAARLTSTRLPGKVLASYCTDGMTNLEQIVRRWQRSWRAPKIICAIPSDAEDAPIEALCRTIDIPCYRGVRDDVVSRMNEALLAFAPDAKYIARGMADSPLVDVGLADGRLDVLMDSGADGLWYNGDESRLTYAATTDVWSRAAWDRIAALSSGSQREHPGSYFWDNLNRFNVVSLNLPRREYVTSIRTELDTPEDLEMFRALWREVLIFDYPADQIIDTLRALRMLNTHPEIAAINAYVQVKTQSRALWRKGSQWLCKACLRRVGAVISGDLEVRCARCGRPQKFYASPAAKRIKPSMMRA